MNEQRAQSPHWPSQSNLAMSCLPKKQRSGSQDDEYLRPTFNQMSRINSRDLSPPPNDPPPIPMQSYSPLRKQSE